MKTINFKTEAETAEALIRYIMDGVKAKAIGRTTIVILD